MTADLIAFLRVRLDEDEQAAQAAGGDQWTPQGHPSDTVAIYDSHREPVVYDEGAPSEAQMRHISRHDPARVLAEVDAKRRLLAAFEQVSQIGWPADPDMILTVKQRITNQVIGQEEGLLTALRLLALPYADHPDYRPEWAPQ
jgi:hypothetical protein